MYLMYGLYLMFVVGVIFFDEIIYAYRVYGIKNYILYYINYLIAALHKIFNL